MKRETIALPARAGRGHPAAHSRADVVQIAAVYEITRHGFLPRDGRLVWLTVVHPRLCVLASQEPGTASTPTTALIARDPTTGDLVCRLIPDGEEAEGMNAPGAPATITAFRVDRFLAALAARMDAVKAGTMPDEPGPLRGADPDPIGSFATDADGEKHLVGLTAAESRELMALNAPGSGREPGGPGQNNEELDAEDVRRSHPQARHQTARIRRAQAEAEAAKEKHDPRQ